jgi:hypothetical protein
VGQGHATKILQVLLIGVLTSINFCADPCHFSDPGVEIPLSQQKISAMKYFNLSLSTLMFRFYLMMAVIIAAGFSGLWFLCFLALPVFFSAMMGIQFKKHHSIKKPDMRRTFDLSSDKHHTAH